MYVEENVLSMLHLNCNQRRVILCRGVYTAYVRHNAEHSDEARQECAHASKYNEKYEKNMNVDVKKKKEKKKPKKRRQSSSFCKPQILLTTFSRGLFREGIIF